MFLNVFYLRVEALYTSFLYGNPLDHLPSSPYRTNFDSCLQKVVNHLRLASLLVARQSFSSVDVKTTLDWYICATAQNKVVYTGDHKDTLDCAGINRIMLALYDIHYRPTPLKLWELIVRRNRNPISSLRRHHSGFLPEEVYDLCSRKSEMEQSVHAIEMEAW